jgi:hypothetical protein
MLRLQWRHNHSCAERRPYSDGVGAACGNAASNGGSIQSSFGTIHSARSAAAAAFGGDASAAASP